MHKCNYIIYIIVLVALSFYLYCYKPLFMNIMANFNNFSGETKLLS